VRSRNKINTPCEGPGDPTHVRADDRTIDRAAVLVDAGFVLQSGDFVLHCKFATFQFCDLQIIGRRVMQRIVEFVFERLMPSFEFRKMRLK